MRTVRHAAQLALIWAVVCAGSWGVPPPLPRIEVRDGRFVEHTSGKSFAPRGFNYIRLKKNWHATFAPDTYEATRAEAMLADLEQRGFNVVRVFIDHSPPDGVVAGNNSEGLSPKYMANVFDFLRRARAHRIYVVPALVWLPPARPYHALASAKTAKVEDVNQLYLSRGAIEAKALYAADFVRAIRDHDPSMASTVFAYELDNETSMNASKPPFSLESGTCVPANGKTYDLASEEALQRMADDHVVLWTDTCAAAIRAVDPAALVGVSVFTFKAVGRTGPGHLRRDTTPDVRFPARPLALAKSKADYLDIHLYSTDADSLAADLTSVEFDEVRDACAEVGKPIIMGEFGAFKHDFAALSDAARAMASRLEWTREAGFDGFLYWTYDTDEQTRLWNALSGEGLIMKALTEALP